MRQQLRELSITSRPTSSRPSMTHQVPRSPLSISGANSPALLGQLQLALPKSPASAGISPNKTGSATAIGAHSSPGRVGSTPPLHPSSPTRLAAVLPSAVQKSPPSKQGVKWGSWGVNSTPQSHSGTPLVQSTDPSRHWDPEWGSPGAQSSSPSRQPLLCRRGKE